MLSVPSLTLTAQLKFCAMIEEKLQTASMSIKDRVARAIGSEVAPEESEHEEEPHVPESHPSESNNSHEIYATKVEERQPVYFNFL